MAFSGIRPPGCVSHEAQWGVVLDGVTELTIEGKTKTLKKDDTYWLKAGAVHSAKIFAGYKDLTFFSQKDRYRIKQRESANQIINAYIKAYNTFDIESMVSLFDENCTFENTSNSISTNKVQGREQLRELAVSSAKLYKNKNQTIEG